MDQYFKIALMLASIALLCLFFYLVLENKGDQFMALVAMIFVILATRLHDIVKLDVTPTSIKAELEQKLAEAQATVKQLHEVAETFGKISVQQIQASNRMGGLKPAEKRQAIEQIMAALKAIDLSNDRINDVLLVAKPFDDFDYWSWTSKPIWRSNDSAIQEARNKFFDISTSRGIGFNPTAAATEAFLAQNNLLRGEIAERMKDWKHYLATGAHRRQNLFEARYDRDDDRLELEDALK
jgi:hypothetical protein